MNVWFGRVREVGDPVQVYDGEEDGVPGERRERHQSAVKSRGVSQFCTRDMAKGEGGGTF